MNILVACEYSGIVRDAFRARGHNAISCDIIPSERPGPHLETDVSELLRTRRGEWEMIIAFPPCTDLSNIGARTWKEKQADGRQQKSADFFRMFFDYAPMVAVENPVGWMNTNFRKPDQIIDPFQFGHPWRKRTCLWLKGLPLLKPTNVVEPLGSWVRGQKGGTRAEQGWPAHEVGVRAGGTRTSLAQRAKERARTFQGIADAMADQWG